MTQQPPPPSMPPVGPPVGPAIPEPKKNFFARHKILTILGALVVLIVVIAIGTGGGDDKPSTANSGSSSEPAAKPDDSMIGLNEPFVSGKFEITILSIETGVPSVGTGGSLLTAKGQYAVVNVSIKNNEKESALFTSSGQKLVDTEERTFDTDGIATANMGDAYLGDIQPGFTVEGAWVFDIAPDSVPDYLEVKSSITEFKAVKVSLK